jgi:transcriptional regulator with XRE-family HTH domain
MAKSDRTRQQERNLTVEQQNAIDLLVTGASDREVAEKVGVSRQTVTNWRLNNLVFQAELHRLRKDLWGNSKDRMRALIPKAIDRLEKTLGDDTDSNGPKVALEVIRATGLHSDAECSFVESDSDDPRELAEIIVKKRKRKSSGLLGDPFWEPSEDDVDKVLDEMQAKGA